MNKILQMLQSGNLDDVEVAIEILLTNYSISEIVEILAPINMKQHQDMLNGKLFRMVLDTRVIKTINSVNHYYISNGECCFFISSPIYFKATNKMDAYFYIKTVKRIEKEEVK